MMRLWVASAALLGFFACRLASPPRAEVASAVPTKPKATAVSLLKQQTGPTPSIQPQSIPFFKTPMLPLLDLKVLPPPRTAGPEGEER